MKQSSLIFTVFFTFLLFIMGGCTSKEEIDESRRHTTTMRLEGSVNGFSDANTKAPTRDVEESHVWKDGDKVYLRFFTNAKNVDGIATYQETTQSWSITYEDELPIDSEANCEIRWFEDAKFSNEYMVNLSPLSAVYEDTTAQYTVSKDGDIVVRAVLSPIGGRIRFAGDCGTKVFLSGIQYRSSYSPSKNKYAFDTKIDTISVLEDGYTPYVYGSILRNDDNRRLGVVTSLGDAFTRNCKDDVMGHGKSGWMNLPTEDSHMGWQRGLLITIQYAEFKMLPVKRGASTFLMAETETTTQQYAYQTQEETPYNYPVSNVSYNECNSYIANINAICPIKLSFALPTLSEWQFAYKGGLYSQGFTYSGSNNIDDVAWYNGNATGTNCVMQKSPNELGLYDMCGNVAEWVCTPTSSSSSYYYVMGGSYSMDATYCVASSQKYNYYASYSYPHVGFRMIMRVP